MAPNEARAGVGRGTAAIADATEAVLGAIYYDGGLEAARRFVRTPLGGCARPTSRNRRSTRNRT